MLTVSIDDVMGVLKLCVPYLAGCGIAIVLAVVVCIACMKMKRPTKFLVRNQAGIAALLAVVVVANLICTGPMSSLLSLLSGEGVISEESSKEAMELCQDIAEEGIVLLENEEGVLPLDEGGKLNVFGWASIDPCYGGTGSGAISDKAEKVSLLKGLKDAGIETNGELSKFYKDYLPQRPVLGYGNCNWTLPEPPVENYSDELLAQAKEYSDKAMIVITRLGGEHADLPVDMTVVQYENNSDKYEDFPAGTHYLELSQSEKDMVKLVCENFEDVIVVYNGANTLELGFCKEYEQIKGVIWCPPVGQNGFRALGEIVSGKVNPSGHAVDTFVYDLTATPYYNNIGEFEYTNVEEFGFEANGYFTEGITRPHFVNYVENIYVGYRFYETAAEEGLITYDEVVQYPFGQGLSYTTFTQKIEDIAVDGAGNVTARVKVENSGNAAGKEVVQVYYNPPYTDGGIEKASANLVAFDKTKELEPGESQTLELHFAKEDMASYDTAQGGGYVLEEGEYRVSVRANSHDILDEKNVVIEEEVRYDKENPRSTDETAAVNQFDFAEGDVTYLSRANHFANYEEAVAAPVDYLMSDEAKAGFYNSHNYNPEDFNDPDEEMPVTGAKNGLKLADLRGADYDDERWEALLDQMTVEEMDNLIALGGYQTLEVKSIEKPVTIDCDGPASINNMFAGLSSIGFPAEVVIASTFNLDLAKEFGRSIGRMADEMNVSGWYAPAMDMHRSAFDGRNFEYYSEDGLLSGLMGAMSVAGAKEYGIYAYVKHFALNDQQVSQEEMLCTWSTEQAIREIYLKPFELCVKVGENNAMMSSWNYIGNVWTGGCEELLTNVLRDEWGFEGMVISDGFHHTGYMNSDQAIRAGGDIMLKNFDVETNHVKDQESATGIRAMRNACHNILYTVANSRACDAKRTTGWATWKVVLTIADAAAVVLVILWEVLAARGYRKRQGK